MILLQSDESPYTNEGTMRILATYICLFGALIFPSFQLFGQSTTPNSLPLKLAASPFNPKAALLPNKSILVIGESEQASSEDIAEMIEFNDKQCKILKIPALDSDFHGYWFQTAILLNDDRVFFTGEGNRNAIFNPKTRTFRHLENPMTGSKGEIFPAVKLENGNIFQFQFGEIAEIFNVRTNRYELINSLSRKFKTAGQTATLLNDGNILIAGGLISPSKSQLKETDVAELFNAKSNAFTKIKSKLHASRLFHTAVLLNDGNVLISGGSQTVYSKYTHEVPNYKSITSVEIYDSKTKRFNLIHNLNVPRARHTATRLNDGKILIVGGEDATAGHVWDTAEIYDPKNNTFKLLKSKMITPRTKHAAILLDNGKVLIIGGEYLKKIEDYPDCDAECQKSDAYKEYIEKDKYSPEYESVPLDSIEIYDPKNETFRQVTFDNCILNLTE